MSVERATVIESTSVLPFEEEIIRTYFSASVNGGLSSTDKLAGENPGPILLLFLGIDKGGALG